MAFVVARLIARMYVHGMSTRDIEATFADVLSGTGVSKSVVSRVTRCLSEDFEAFRKRDLSNEKLLYLELDGTYLRYHQGAERKEPILVATGYRADGTRDLLHIGVGNRESYENWKGFLQEMVARGMREPLLIVTDGNPGVLKAIAEVFPRSLKQRCQKHRLENILCKAPKEVRDELKAPCGCLCLRPRHRESIHRSAILAREGPATSRCTPESSPSSALVDVLGDLAVYGSGTFG